MNDAGWYRRGGSREGVAQALTYAFPEEQSEGFAKFLKVLDESGPEGLDLDSACSKHRS